MIDQETAMQAMIANERRRADELFKKLYADGRDDVERAVEDQKYFDELREEYGVKWRGGEQSGELIDMACKAIEDMMKQFEKIGMIKDTIESAPEFGLSREDTKKRLVEKLGLNTEKAEEYMDRYWK